MDNSQIWNPLLIILVVVIILLVLWWAFSNPRSNYPRAYNDKVYVATPGTVAPNAVVVDTGNVDVVVPAPTLIDPNLPAAPLNRTLVGSKRKGLVSESDDQYLWKTEQGLPSRRTKASK